jgi:5-methylcytosine-specific restriction protein A
VDEFERLGRMPFLDKYGFGRAKTYFLALNGKEYDSKAIMGYAHGHAVGEYLRSEDFTGGEASVVRHLRDRLGFVVKAHRNPPWTWDEVVLACALVKENGWRWLGRSDPRVGELSDLLQLYPAHPSAVRGPDFRNRNGRRTQDLRHRRLPSGLHRQADERQSAGCRGACRVLGPTRRR